MAEHFVPEGPAYLPNSFGPGFGPCHSTTLGCDIKSEIKLEEFLTSYQADTPPGRDLSTSSWTSTMGCWLEEDMSDTPTNMYDFNLLTPENTPPRITSQSNDIGDLSDVLSSLSSHPSPTFAAECVDDMLPPYSPPQMSPPIVHNMTVLSPPPIIHTFPPPQATPPDQIQNPMGSSLPPVTKRKASGSSGGSKRRRLTEPRKQRKREQNKAAALKYRSRKKQEKLSLDEQKANLEQEKSELSEKIKCAEEEIAYLKSMLQEVCGSTPTMLPDVPSSSEEIGSFKATSDLLSDMWSEINQLGPLFPF